MESQKFIPYAHQNIDEKDIRSVSEALRKNLITRGKSVAAFEQAIAEKVKAQFAVAFSSGSTALTAAFQAGKTEPTDLVISTPNTFIASVAPAIKAGALLRLVDIDTYGNIDISQLPPEAYIPRSRGKVIFIPVHFGGIALDMKKLNESLTTPNVLIIEDAAHALGSKYPDDTLVGSCAYSDMTVLSFHPVKNITCGEGGMITTNNENLYSRLKCIRNNGIDQDNLHHGSKAPWYYEVNELSSNYNMTEMQAALGLSQLQHLEEWGKKKRELVTSYRRKLSSVPGISLLPSEADERTHFHLFVVFIAFEELGITRTQLMEDLAAEGIGTQYHYIPLFHHEGLLKNILHKNEHFPAMQTHFNRALSLPLFSSMKEEDIDRVVMSLKKVLFQIFPKKKA